MNPDFDHFSQVNQSNLSTCLSGQCYYPPAYRAEGKWVFDRTIQRLNSLKGTTI